MYLSAANYFGTQFRSIPELRLRDVTLDFFRECVLNHRSVGTQDNVCGRVSVIAEAHRAILWGDHRARHPAGFTCVPLESAVG